MNVRITNRAQDRLHRPTVELVERAIAHYQRLRSAGLGYSDAVSDVVQMVRGWPVEVVGELPKEDA